MIIIKLISVNLPESYLKVLEMLVTEGKFPNRSEAIRVGIRDLIKAEYLLEESVVSRSTIPGVISDVEKEIPSN